jgi:hypothetical protein
MEPVLCDHVASARGSFAVVRRTAINKITAFRSLEKMPTTTFRGHTITDLDVLDAMTRFDRDERSTFTRWKTYAIKHSGNDYPPKQILRVIVGEFPKLFGGEPTNHRAKGRRGRSASVRPDTSLYGVGNREPFSRSASAWNLGSEWFHRQSQVGGSRCSGLIAQELLCGFQVHAAMTPNIHI